MGKWLLVKEHIFLKEQWCNYFHLVLKTFYNACNSRHGEFAAFFEFAPYKWHSFIHSLLVGLLLLKSSGIIIMDPLPTMTVLADVRYLERADGFVTSTKRQRQRRTVWLFVELIIILSPGAHCRRLSLTPVGLVRYYNSGALYHERLTSPDSIAPGLAFQHRYSLFQLL